MLSNIALIFLPLQIIIINITTATIIYKITQRVPKIQVQVPPNTQVLTCTSPEKFQGYSSTTDI